MFEIAFLLWASLLISLVCAVLRSEWLAMEISSMIMGAALTLGIVVFQVPESVITWGAVGLSLWLFGNWVFWGQYRKRRAHAGQPRSRPDPVIKYWPHLTALGLAIYLIGLLLVLSQPASTPGWLARYMGAMVIVFAPLFAFLARSFSGSAQ